MKLLVTGGAGFIGSNFIHYVLKNHPDYKIINLDLLTYAGNLENLKEVENNKNYEFVKGDVCDVKLVDSLVKKGWTLFNPPLLANYDCFMGTGFFPGVDQQNIYAVGGQDESKWANRTRQSSFSWNIRSKLSVVYHKDEVLKYDDLPKKYAGYSACFKTRIRYLWERYKRTL